jgi:hypothetical protein
MSRRVLHVVVWLFLSAPAYAQTLTITGEVKDQSDATNAVRTQQSNQAGQPSTCSIIPCGAT